MNTLPMGELSRAVASCRELSRAVAGCRGLSRLEQTQGTRGRSAEQIDAWNLSYGPTDADGYPRRLWDLATGEIDREVAHSMGDHGIGPSLVGKLRRETDAMMNATLDAQRAWRDRLVLGIRELKSTTPLPTKRKTKR